jgi:signal transduction histidine kinase
LLNACEASQPGPAKSGPDARDEHRPDARARIECEVRLRAARPGADGGQVLVTVADHGPGVPDSVRRRVFDPFFSTKARGTGLGLSICRQIVEEHGGRIRLLNRQGGGTRVVIELPAAPRSMLPMLLENVS